jgi:protein SCO1/2
MIKKEPQKERKVMYLSRNIVKGIVVVVLCIGTAYLSWIYTPVVPLDKQQDTFQLGGAFQLIDSEGKVRHSQEFKNRYLLLYFGYGYCPDVCPLALHNISDALYQLEAEGRSSVISKLQPLFITIDPQRDTPDTLKEFISQFHPRFIALTGSDADIQNVTALYKVFYQKVKEKNPQDDQHYLMDHSSIVYVMDPKGYYCGSFNHLTPPQEIALKLKEWIK